MGELQLRVASGDLTKLPIPGFAAITRAEFGLYVTMQMPRWKQEAEAAIAFLSANETKEQS